MTHNSASAISSCLAALPAALNGVRAEAIIADNASTDDTISRAKQAMPTVQLVSTGGNHGYGAALNAGYASATAADFILVLNPDTRVAPGAVSKLVRALQVPGRGIAVPRMLGSDGQLAFSVRREPTLRTALGEAVLGGVRAGRYTTWSELITDPKRYSLAGPVDWATGAALLVTRECWDAVGGWDESFLLYSEETDFMLRARDHGFSTWFVPEAVVSHDGGESSTSPFLWSLLMANRVRLFARRRGTVAAFAFRLVLTAGESLRAATGSKRARAALTVLLRPSRRPDRLPS